jgi:hypothetical protein
MKTFNVLALHLGSPTLTEVSAELLTFYRSVAKAVTGEYCELSQAEPLHTLPFDSNSILKKSHEIYSKILERVAGWQQSPDLLIVDASSLVAQSVERGGVLVHIAQAVSSILTSERQNPLKVVLFLPQIPPLEDLFLQPLIPLWEKEFHLLIVADDGSLHPPENPPLTFDSEAYRVNLARTRESPKEQIKAKLIRRLGHFQRDINRRSDATVRNGKSCARYSYDGVLCKEEIETLLTEYLSNTLLAGEDVFILYRCPQKHWLEDPLCAAALHHNIAIYRTIDVNDDLVAAQKLRDKRVLLVLPMLDTGWSLNETLVSLEDHLPEIKPQVLSILLTNPESEQRGRTFKYKDGDLLIDYFIEITQKRVPSSECAMCKLGIPTMDYYRDEYLMLTSYDVWEMAHEYGWKPEDDVPSYRGEIPSIPDFPKMIQENGMWLAHKMWKRLEASNDNIPTDLVIVCPDEKGARIFATYLLLINRATSIFIPREVLNLFAEDNSTEKTVVFDQNSSWYQMLVSSPVGGFLILDEFNYTGRTKRAMQRLLTYLGKQPLGYFALVNLDPATADDDNITTYSLYEFQAR